MIAPQTNPTVINGTTLEFNTFTPSQIPSGTFFYVRDAGPLGTLYILDIDSVGVRTWKIVSSGSAPVPSTYADRVDLSVNGAMVEAHQSLNAILRTQTNNNPAGSYFGGGTGNKAILGNSGFDHIRLDTLMSCRWRHRNLSPLVAYNLITTGYMNLVIELVPSTGVYSIFTFVHQQGGGINCGVPSVPAVNELQMDWTFPVNYVQVVLDKGMFDGGGWIVTPVVGPVVPFPPNTADWSSRAYAVPDILAEYPNAEIRNAYPLDGGLPLSTVMSGVMLILGDSTTKVIGQRLLMEWTLNEAPI